MPFEFHRRSLNRRRRKAEEKGVEAVPFELNRPKKREMGLRPCVCADGREGKRERRGSVGVGSTVRGDKREEWRGFEMDPKFLFI